MAIGAPSLGGVGDRVKRVPKLVWVIGGGIVLGYVVLKGKAGGGGGGTPAGLSTTGGGGGGGDTGQATITSEDLSTFLADQAQSQSDFQQSLLDMIGGVSPPTPVPPGGGPTTPPPSGGTVGNTGGGTTTPPAVTNFKVSLTGRTNLLSSAGKIIGHGASGTYAATKITLRGKSYYRFKRAGRWTFIPTSATTIKATPVTPAK